MTKHINGLKKCSCGGYPKLTYRDSQHLTPSVRFYNLVCPVCGNSSGTETTVTKAKQTWNKFSFKKKVL